MNINFDEIIVGLYAKRRSASKKMEERMANTPRMDGWEVPEGAERFGMARRDLDYIDPSKNRNN